MGDSESGEDEQDTGDGGLEETLGKTASVEEITARVFKSVDARSKYGKFIKILGVHDRIPAKRQRLESGEHNFEQIIPKVDFECLLCDNKKLMKCDLGTTGNIRKHLTVGNLRFGFVYLPNLPLIFISFMT